MKINGPMYKLRDDYFKVNDKKLFYLYVNNIVNLESLSKKDDDYEINKTILEDNIKKVKKELVKRKNKYIV